MRNLFFFLSIFLLLGKAAHSEERIKLIAFTAKLPPFSIGNKSEPAGFLHELVEEIAKRSNIDLEIRYVPWKRAQTLTQRTPNSIVFGMARTKAREQHYSWLVELMRYNYVFVSTKKKINTYAEARKLQNVTVLLGTPREKILKANGFTNYRALSKVDTNVKNLQSGRADGWFTIENRAIYAWKNAGLPNDKLKIGKPIKVSHNWIGGHRTLSKEVKARFQESLDSARADGFYDQLYKKYFGELVAQ